jgi:hypothetical protein
LKAAAIITIKEVRLCVKVCVCMCVCVDSGDDYTRKSGLIMENE